MRERELRLGRTLRRIVMVVLAPLPGVAACRAATDSHPVSDAGVGVTADAGNDADTGRDADALASLDGDVDAETGGFDFDAAACPSIVVDTAAYDDAADGCSDFRSLPCGLPPDTLLEGCYPYPSTCKDTCGSDAALFYCQLAQVTCTGTGTMVPDAGTVVECVRCAVGGGRRPRGLCAEGGQERTPVGDYFASMAYLEAASVRAFHDLELYLAALGAPSALTCAARAAAVDERRHARAASRLAHRFGGVAVRPRVEPKPAPTLYELLEDDAVEGCVGETFGALLALWQSEVATDPDVRRTMRSIAEDETRHAALAWEIFGWGAPLLREGERAKLAQTFEDALAALGRHTSIAVDASVERTAGYPSPAAAAELVNALSYAVRHEAASAS